MSAETASPLRSSDTEASSPAPQGAGAKSLPPLTAWRNALGITVVMWLVLALPGMGLLTDYLAKAFRNDVLMGAFWLEAGLTPLAALVVAALISWQRHHGETLKELGWKRPTNIKGMVAALIFGGLITASMYTQPGLKCSPWDMSWQRPIMMLMGSFLVFTEEVAFRGFFMEQLRRGGVPTWLQVIAAGLAMGSYHGVLGFHYTPLYAISGAVMFTIFGGIFVLGKRSLTPVIIGHAMAHFFGDPAAAMGMIHGAIMLAAR